MSKTKDLSYLPKFYDRYIKLVDSEMTLIDVLKRYKSLYRDQLSKLTELGDRIYAPEKWNAKQIIQHITDNERIMSCRMMRIARNEGVELPGYEQDILGKNARVDHRSLENVIEEFEICRMATIALVGSLNQKELDREGICSTIKLQAGHLAFQMPGHQIHHQNILEERYFALFSI